MLIFNVLFIVALFILLIVVGTGVTAFLVKSTMAATVCEVICRITFVVAMLTLMFVVAPRIRELYMGFGVKLPWITIVVLNCTTLKLWQSILVGLMMVGGVVVDGILFATFHDQKSTRRTTQWCSFAITLILTAIQFLIVTALYIPMVRLMNDLS